MPKRWFYLNLLLLAILLLLATGCEKDGKIKIYNRTSYPVQAGIYEDSYTIAGNSDLTVDITTGRQTPFDSNVGTWVEIFLAGETYQIYDDYEQAYVPKTSVWVAAGKTTTVYLDPNRACVKVINQTTDKYIKKIIVQRNTFSNAWTNEYNVFMAPNDEWFIQVPPGSTQTPYYYIVQVVFENDSILSYGSETNILYADDRFLVLVE